MLATLSACSGNSSHLDVGPAPVGVTIDSRVVYYDVTAATLTELRRAMVQQGPKWEGRSWSAVTQSRYRWTFQHNPRGPRGCELHHVKVRLQTEVTFPRWNPSAEPDSAMMEWWRQLNAGLAEHERGHALLAVKTAGEIVKALDGMAQGQCDALTLQANRAAQMLVEQSQQKQLEYDQTTRHGATQIRLAARLRDP